MKNNYWQNIRGVCILAVILIHCLYTPYLSEYFIINIIIRKIVDFAVPLFIFMSAIFIKKDSIKNFYKKKIFRLLPSLIIWNFIYIMIWYLNNDFDLFSFIKTFLLSSSVPHLYYLYVLIRLFLLVPFIRFFIKKINCKYLIFLPLLITPIYNMFLLVYWILIGAYFPLYQYLIFGWFSYFYLGFLLTENKIKMFNIRNCWLIIFFLLFSILEGIMVYKYAGSYTLGVSQLGIINSFFCMLLICILYFKSKLSIFNSKFLTNLGNYSFGIYLSHILVLKLVKNILDKMELNYYINVLIIFVITVVVCYIFNLFYYRIIKKYIFKRKVA